MTNFALIGAAGFVAPRHMRAINDVGCRLVAATDPHVSVGVLDKYSLDTKFFPEIEGFNRYLEELQRGPQEDRVDWVSVCSPNYLHFAHIYMALQSGANVLCEKPLVVDPRDLDILQILEQRYGRRVFTVLQLRLQPNLLKLKEELDKHPEKSDHEVLLTYVTARGPWYDATWKGREEHSGGVGVNIGIHLLDVLLWLFGDVVSYEVHLRNPKQVGGVLQLQRARVRWFLSTEQSDLPFVIEPGVKFSHREIVVDGESVEFSGGFIDAHTSVYKETLAGRGMSIAHARPAAELADSLRTSPIVTGEPSHPLIQR